MRKARARRLELRWLAEPLAVCWLPAKSPLPVWTGGGDFFSLTRARGELSVVGPYARVPRGVRRQGPFRALRVKGPLAFSEVGIVASLTALLAEARIPIFVLSTYKTDYLLVPQRHLHPALRALRIAGHRIRRPR